jgi:DNA polymerase-1
MTVPELARILVEADVGDIKIIDFEFQVAGGRHSDPEHGRDSGGRVLPLSLVVWSLITGRIDRYWRDELLQMREAPFDTGPRTLVVAWFWSAEGNCFAALRWRFPRKLICSHAEYRWWQNGIVPDKPPGLVEALQKFNLPCIGVAAKEANREKILTTSHWSASDIAETLDYNQSDVLGTGAVFCKLAPKLDVQRAMLRGRYSAACGVIEHRGIPLDAEWWDRFARVREPVLLRMIQKLDRFHLYDGMTFKENRFNRLLARLRIPWDRVHEGGRHLRRDADYFRDQVTVYPILDYVHVLRQTISKLKKPKLCIGPDARNRTLIGPWGTITGRNAYSTNKSIFGPDRWTRFTILPTEGSALAYVDWTAQEIGIAAIQSKDENLLETYLALDPYLHFAMVAGLLPTGTVRGPDAVEVLRDKIKILFLGMGYGMTLYGLTWRLGGDRALAERLWKQHHEHYRVFWRWIGHVLDNADMRGWIQTMSRLADASRRRRASPRAVDQNEHAAKLVPTIAWQRNVTHQCYRLGRGARTDLLAGARRISGRGSGTRHRGRCTPDPGDHGACRRSHVRHSVSRQGPIVPST